MTTRYAVIDPATGRVVECGQADEKTIAARNEPGIVTASPDTLIELGMFYEDGAFRHPDKYELGFDVPLVAAVGAPYSLPLLADMTTVPALPFTPEEPGIIVLTIRRKGFEDHQFVIEARGRSENRRAAYPTLEEFADAFYWERRGNPEPMRQYMARIDAVKTQHPKI
jgi:hypothetical protein